MKYRVNALFVLLLTFVSLLACAQAQKTSTLLDPITIQPSKPADDDKAIEIASFSVQSSVYANLAETQISISFYNPNNRNIAADFIFPLPQQSTLTGYALDINGVMVDGVALEKHKARVTFEKIVRAGIDPGLVENVQGNVFKTRIFPLNAKQQRSIKIKYTTILSHNNSHYSYQIPLMAGQLIKQFDLKIQAFNSQTKPIISSSQFGSLDFSKWQNAYVTQFSGKDFKLENALSIEVPQLNNNAITVAKNKANEYYFAINPQIATRLKKHLQATNQKKYHNIQLIWDASDSRANAAHELEIDFLNKFFNQHQNINVELFILRNTLNKQGHYKITQGNWGKLKQKLKSTHYDGATNLSTIKQLNHKSSNQIILFFTDAQHTFLAKESLTLPIPLYLFNSSLATNTSYAQQLAENNQGQSFWLNQQTDFSQLAQQIGKPIPQLISITQKNGRLRNLPTLPQKINLQSQQPITGQLLSDNATIVLNYGITGEILEKITINISKENALATKLIELISVQQRLRELEKDAENNKSSILKLAQTYNLATSFTSLLVLDNLEQYVQNHIAPPQSLAQMRDAYFKQIKQLDKQKSSEQQDKIAHIISQWNQRQQWWHKKFPKTVPKPKKQHGMGRTTAQDDEGDRIELDGTMVTGSRIATAEAYDSMEEEPTPVEMKPQKKQANTQASVKISEWNPDTPYLKELAKTNKARTAEVYYRLKKDYRNSPAFYFDCANFFFQQQQNDFAIQVLSNIAELKIQDSRLLRTMAMALRKHNKFTISIWAYEKVLKDRSEEPQSYRDLAITLIQRVENNQSTDITQDYTQAIELLYKVVTTNWDRFDGIEITVLMEINALIPQLQKFTIDYSFINKKLIALLDVDLRITLAWDSDMTDIDLWVIEPSGEKVTYSQTLSTVGGMFHKDFTGGYGPEEYLLHKAPSGKYTIKVHFYGNNSPELTGATTLYVDVFTNFARTTQKRQTLSLRLEKQDDDYLVGEITITND